MAGYLWRWRPTDGIAGRHVGGIMWTGEDSARSNWGGRRQSLTILLRPQGETESIPA